MYIQLMAKGQEFPKLLSNSILISNQDITMLVDGGGFDRTLILEQNLLKHGFSLDQIDLLLFTHLHADHLSDVFLFKNAQIALHWREWELLEKWLKTPEHNLNKIIQAEYEIIHTSYVRFFVRSINALRTHLQHLLKDKARCLFLDDEYFMTPNIKVIESPGHTIGHVSVWAKTEKRSVWITGDAITSLPSWLKRHEPITGICANIEAQQRTLKYFEDKKGLIVPGHGQPFDIENLQIVTLEEFL